MPEEIIIEKRKPIAGTIVITFLLSALIFGFLGYYLGARITSPVPDAPVVETAGISEESPAASLATDPTGGWKTYTNNEIGISFKYPIEWKEPQFIKHDSEPKEADGIKGHIYTNSDNDGNVYSDKFNMFRLATSSKDYTSFFNDAILSKRINYDWTEEEFNNNIIKDTSFKLEFFKKLADNVILIGTYQNIECSQSLGVSIITPLNDDYPNFEISIDGKYGTDPIISAAENKARNDNTDICGLEPAFSEVAQKVKDGNYSNDVNQSIETAKQIASTVKSIK